MNRKIAAAALGTLLAGSAVYGGDPAAVLVKGSDGISALDLKNPPRLIMPVKCGSYMVRGRKDNKKFIHLAGGAATKNAVQIVFEDLGGERLVSRGTRVDMNSGRWCHIGISPDGTAAVVSDYSGGTVSIRKIEKNGVLGKIIKDFRFSGKSVHKRQQSPHPHFAAFDPAGEHILVCDLGSDRIWIKSRNEENFRSGAVLPPGSGPRHLIFSADGRYVYVANELNNTVSSFRYDKGKLTSLEHLALLRKDGKKSSFAGAIKLSPCGRFVLVTNRGENSISVLERENDGKLKHLGNTPVKGDFPYDIQFAGKDVLVVVNMKSSSVEFYRFTGGKLSFIRKYKVNRPVCVIK